MVQFFVDAGEEGVKEGLWEGGLQGVVSLLGRVLRGVLRVVYMGRGMGLAELGILRGTRLFFLVRASWLWCKEIVSIAE